MKQPFPKQVFVSGIGTGVGKTIVSAVLAEALQADYWKPVQCGSLENSDSQVVRSLISNRYSIIHAEGYALKTASSPHYAAVQEGMQIDTTSLKAPVTNRILIMEGAGGLMVPLNRRQLLIDYIQQAGTPVVLVAGNYLGAINHTLLSVEVLKHRGIPLCGIVFRGKSYFDNEDIIQQFTGLNILGHVDEAGDMGAGFILQQAEKMRSSLSKYYNW